MKNKLLPLAIGVAIIGCALAVYANMNSSGFKTDLEQERSKRFLAEEKLQKAQQQVALLQVDLGDAKSKMASIEKILTDGKTMESDLKAELDAIKKEREQVQSTVTIPLENMGTSETVE